MAYTSTWIAISSQLAYWRRLYGPQVLLQLNLAYYLPSIPLLAVSALTDKLLTRKLGAWPRGAQGAGGEGALARAER